MSAYATILDQYEGLAKRDRAAADRQLEQAVVDLAARLHWQSSGPDTELLMFSDGANDCLFDATNKRTVLMYGRSKTTPANSRETPYHQGYSRAGDGYEKGHAISHAQGGLEGGPNYFKQKRTVNQRRSAAGNLWRDIETYLATNAGVFAFCTSHLQTGGNRRNAIRGGVRDSQRAGPVQGCDLSEPMKTPCPRLARMHNSPCRSHADGGRDRHEPARSSEQ